MSIKEKLEQLILKKNYILSFPKEKIIEIINEYNSIINNINVLNIFIIID